MEMIKLVRFADEGFVNYPQQHIYAGNPIYGCFAFIDREHSELLSYKEDFKKLFPDVVDRKEQKRHEVVVSGDTLVYVRNQKLPADYSEIFLTKPRILSSYQYNLFFVKLLFVIFHDL